MSVRTKLLATVSVLAALVAGISAVVHSSFTATAKNEGNTFETGSISLTDSDNDQFLFQLDGLQPGTAPEKRCVKVAYGSTGGLRSSVRLFGETSGSLAPHLRLKVERGTFSGAVPSGNRCDGFARTHSLFDGTLDGYPDAWPGGIVDPHAAWGAGDSAVYQFEVSVADTDDAQGKSASQAFAFEARTS